MYILTTQRLIDDWSIIDWRYNFQSFRNEAHVGLVIRWNERLSAHHWSVVKYGLLKYISVHRDLFSVKIYSNVFEIYIWDIYIIFYKWYKRYI